MLIYFTRLISCFGKVRYSCKHAIINCLGASKNISNIRKQHLISSLQISRFMYIEIKSRVHRVQIAGGYQIIYEFYESLRRKNRRFFCPSGLSEPVSTLLILLLESWRETGLGSCGEGCEGLPLVPTLPKLEACIALNIPRWVAST